MEKISFTPFNYVSNSITLFLVVLRALVTSRKDDEFNPAKMLSVEATWTMFSSGPEPNFHSNTLPVDDFDMVSSPLFLVTDLFSMLLVLLSK
jgi:hypothetical protein